MSKKPQDLAELARGTTGALTRRLKAESRNITSLPAPQQAVLARLQLKPDQTSAELAREEVVRPQSMSRTVMQLLDAGFITVHPSPDDGRQRLLRLTPKGNSTIETLRLGKNDWLRQKLHTLDPTQRATIAQAMSLLKSLLETP
ncbi:hypothetical protein BWP39_09920 [Paraburkholderia acidicola]|uniref:HTH marR-type domain-containing protein n=1 Tax=Paraburkholderia acidicola TaxID=1912599 RepID=A0A2A4F302_9BURK|nr:MarR family transcriptional regulator [Paraburkholderia acidicola]PCE27092.1 hypothetical protein BWP39_09920 [Paraburkholderia acidicola]